MLTRRHCCCPWPGTNCPADNRTNLEYPLNKKDVFHCTQAKHLRLGVIWRAGMPFELLKTEIVYPAALLPSAVTTLRLPDGHQTRFDIVEHVGSVIIIHWTTMATCSSSAISPCNGWISWSCLQDIG